MCEDILLLTCVVGVNVVGVERQKPLPHPILSIPALSLSWVSPSPPSFPRFTPATQVA